MHSRHVSKASIGIATLIAVGCLSFQNCSGGKFQTNDSGSGGIVGSTGLASSSEGLGTCQLISPRVLSGRLKNILNISVGDVQILNSDGSNSGLWRISSNLHLLGEGNIAAGIPDNFSCTVGKFEIYIQVMVDACMIGMSDPATKMKLFPNGLHDFNTVYQAFTGRLPNTEEIQVMSDMTRNMMMNQEAGVCAAVGSSMASLLVI